MAPIHAAKAWQWAMIGNHSELSPADTGREVPTIFLSFRRRPEAHARRLAHQIEALGFRVTIEATEQAA